MTSRHVSMPVTAAAAVPPKCHLAAVADRQVWTYGQKVWLGQFILERQQPVLAHRVHFGA
jgi:hypothetical protein